MFRALTSRGARGAVLAAMALAGPARAADQVEACIDAHERAQASRREGRLRAAREALLGCTRPSCPVAIRLECDALLERVEASQPTVVVEARDRAGADTAAVRVFVDGTLALERLDGKAFAIDPGEHVFRYELAGGPAAEARVVVREGERNRKIVASFVTPAAAPAPAAGAPARRPPADAPARRPGSAWPYVAAGAGALALGSFAYFALTGRERFDRLKAECAPPAGAGCAADDVRGVRTRLAVADVSLGVALAAIGASAYLFVARPAAARPALSLVVGPSPGGAGASFAASF